MKYLIDSLNTYEKGYSDALCPSFKNGSFGQSELAAPITKSDIPLLAKSVVSAVHSCGGPVSYPSAPNFSSTGYSVNAPVDFPSIPPLNASKVVNLSIQASAPLPEKSPVEKKGLGYKNDPLPGVYIPNLSRNEGAWREAVRQWEEGDLEKGLKPLREWPKAWYTGDMRLRTASKRNSRQRIWEEYER